MSKMFLMAIAAIAALFGSAVTWAVTKNPVQSARETRADGARDRAQRYGRGGDRAAFGPVTWATVESRLKARFSLTDSNGDGFVTRSEAESAGEKARMARRDFAFGAMDADKNGTVSRLEFDAQADARRAQFKEGRGRQFGGGRSADQRKFPGFIGARQFDKMDANGDGRLSYDEALAPALERFKSSDSDGDGSLSREERRTARQKFRAERRERR